MSKWVKVRIINEIYGDIYLEVEDGYEEVDLEINLENDLDSGMTKIDPRYLSEGSWTAYDCGEVDVDEVPADFRKKSL